MGSFVNYMYTFVKEYNDANGFMTRKRISEWFKDKKAIKRNISEIKDFQNKKSAVIVVGVSCIGKSTYVQKFLAQYPYFTAISYDDACYQQVDEIKSGAKNTESRLIEILEEKILNVQDENIIIDSMCINPALRAALIRFLMELDYEIHLIFFTRAYTEKNIEQCIANRAIEQVLYKDYLSKNNTSKMYMKEIMLIRNNILEIYANEKNTTVDELKNEISKSPSISSDINTLTRLYNKEIEKNRVWWQEKRELFMLGADYYYEI